MRRCLAGLSLLLATGCATLDPTRPIEKGSMLFALSPEQDGHTLHWMNTAMRLQEFEESRVAAKRALTTTFVAQGMDLVGLPLFFVGDAKKNQALKWTGAGLVVLALVPGFMSSHYMEQAIDQYNGRFKPAPASAALTLGPYVATGQGGGTAGVAGRF
jgi:hypothetical protein